MLQTVDKQKTMRNWSRPRVITAVSLRVSVGYLGFFDQLQQVFDMLSQQILALPHLIQSSERIQKRISVLTLTGQQM